MDQDPVFGPLLRQLLARIVQLCGARMRDDVVCGRGTLLIASPQRITAYHIDSDVNFLFQIAGDKQFSVFDPCDRTLLTEIELEQYHAVDYNGAVFKPERQQDAHIYALRGGLGVHVPWTAPHWACTGNDVSVALSLNYDLRSILEMQRVYQFNRRLGRLGLRLAAAGVSRWHDPLKGSAERCLIGLRRTLKPSTRQPRVTEWTPNG